MRFTGYVFSLGVLALPTIGMAAPRVKASYATNTEPAEDAAPKVAPKASSKVSASKPPAQKAPAAEAPAAPEPAVPSAAEAPAAGEAASAPPSGEAVATAAPATPTEAERLRDELVALREEVVALRASLVPAPVVDPAEVERAGRRAEQESRVAAIRTQSTLLDSAVGGGLPESLVALSRADLALQLEAAEAELAAMDAPIDAVATVAEVAPSEADASAFTWVLDAGLGSAYAFRGANIFAAGDELGALFAPAASVTLGDSGVTLGWWGGYQITGEGAAALVDAGLGGENDLYVSWARPVTDTVKVGAALTGYLYPFAAPDAAGTAFPVYVEPSASVTWSPGVDLGLSVAYTLGVQDALATWRYLYVRPTVGKTVALPAGLGLSVGAAAGWKGYTSEDAPTDNVWDAGVDLALQKDFDHGLYVKPSVHAVWTNLADTGFADSTFAWFGLNAGVAL